MLVTCNCTYCACFSNHQTKCDKSVLIYLLHYYYYYNTCLTALCLGLPRSAGTRKVRPIWILLKRETSGWQWHQLGYMQICTLPQTDNHTSNPLLSFYRPDALPGAQPTVSKHSDQSTLPHLLKPFIRKFFLQEMLLTC